MRHTSLRYRHGATRHPLALRLALACSALSACHSDSSAASIDHVCLLQRTLPPRPDDDDTAMELEEELIDLTNQIEKNQQAVADIEQERGRAKPVMKLKKEEITRMMKENDVTLHQYQNITAKYGPTMGEVEALARKVAQAEQAFRETDARRAELRQEVAQEQPTPEQLHSIEAEKANKSAALVALVASNMKREKELQQAQRLLSELKANVTDAEGEKARAEETRRALMDHNGATLVMGDEWNQKLDKMFNSLSEAYYAHQAMVKTLDRVRSALAATTATS
mmetsp:Transcript_29848/g.84067  ORF Transcript_29848/g.84067 Transcript_29848/m.84067 type:complete len:281 (+) Transcript_29848:23-865(+)